MMRAYDHDPAEYWWLHARCRGDDTNRFFTPDGSRDPERTRLIQAAQTICRTCPVRGECLIYARRNGIHHGVWGGVDMAQDMQSKAGTNRSYVQTCAGTCGRTVATPALMQSGYVPVACHGMCQACYSQRLRQRNGARSMSEVHAAHEDVIRQHRRGIPIERIAINTEYSPTHVLRIIKRHRGDRS